jgi:hypothetical protein
MECIINVQEQKNQPPPHQDKNRRRQQPHNVCINLVRTDQSSDSLKWLENCGYFDDKNKSKSFRDDTRQLLQQPHQRKSI